MLKRDEVDAKLHENKLYKKMVVFLSLIKEVLLVTFKTKLVLNWNNHCSKENPFKPARIPESLNIHLI